MLFGIHPGAQVKVDAIVHPQADVDTLDEALAVEPLAPLPPPRVQRLDQLLLVRGDHLHRGLRRLGAHQVRVCVMGDGEGVCYG